MNSSSALVVEPEHCLEQYEVVRDQTMRLVEPLAPEDTVVQSMNDASPTKWHMAHTTWFFETFLLEQFDADYAPFHERFKYLFNSYYNAVGEMHPRPRRGMLTRPTLDEVVSYRRHVDARVIELLRSPPSAHRAEIVRIAEIGCHHEQQHQELLLTDLKHLFAQSSMHPTYRGPLPLPSGAPGEIVWVGVSEGIRRIGHPGDGFFFDNEVPSHRVFLQAFELADRLITNGEYLAFVEDGGYERPELWLDEGWATVRREGWRSPSYWLLEDGSRREFTLRGVRELEPHDPVCHVSYFEADAFARWAGARLPTEAEWESACQAGSSDGGFLEGDRLHPGPDAGTTGIRQAFGEVWQWTSSSYGAYPGYKPLDGALGEYNGKFMCGQYVLRGASCATSRTHARRTYRNFFYPAARWQFSGIRLARDAR